ncbi:rhamnan synthesis F family protein [Sulfurimonas sp.]
MSAKLVFVTVSDISIKDRKRLEGFGIEVIKRKNIGYDFYSYKVGLQYLDLSLYDELIICNDSSFGPLIPMINIFEQMNNQECDFWGITDSNLIAYHLQSYFLVFKKKSLYSDVFKHFWNDLKILDDKQDIIEQYEVGMSQLFIKNGYKSCSYILLNIERIKIINILLSNLFQAPGKIYKIMIQPWFYFKIILKKECNVSINFWETLLVEEKVPFLKKSLLTDETDKKENFKKIKKIFEEQALDTNYPFQLIDNYYNRLL